MISVLNWFRQTKKRDDYYLEAIEIVCSELHVSVDVARKLFCEHLDWFDQTGQLSFRHFPWVARHLVETHHREIDLHQGIAELRRVYG